MVGLFRRKKKQRKANFIDNESHIANTGDKGRADSVYSYDNDSPETQARRLSWSSPELQQIDTEITKLEKQLKKNKSNETWTSMSEVAQGNWMPNTSQNVTNAKNLVLHIESEIRNLKLRRTGIVGNLKTKQPSTLSTGGSLPMGSIPDVTGSKGSLPKGMTLPQSKEKKQPSKPADSEAINILKMRFAKGEISKDEFQEMKKLLE